MSKAGHLEFNFIYIVESLDSDELPTGSYLDLFVTKPRVEEMARSGLAIGAEVVDVATAADLFAFLERVRVEVDSVGRSPILHLEIHGSSDQQGLILRSSEFVAWDALLEPLTRINRATGNNLLLTLAVCHGAWLGRILSASRPAPFWAVIGPSTSEYPLVLFPAFQAFYATLLDNLDGAEAVAALLQAANTASKQHSFSVLHSERIFARSFRRYVEEQCNPRAIEQRVSTIIAEGKRRALARGAAVPDSKWEELAATYSRRMADTRPVFDEYRRRFFMIDVWPENEQRFTLTYDQTVNGESDRT